MTAPHTVAGHTAGIERPDDDALEPHLPEYVKGDRRCAIQKSEWLTGWYVPWSPRNDNQNAEGPWSHWVALAQEILRIDQEAIAKATAARQSNDICVQISASRNVVYQAGKEQGAKEALTQRPPEQAGAVPGERHGIREYLIACADEADRQRGLYAGKVASMVKLSIEAKTYRNAARMIDEDAHASYRTAAPTPPDAGPGEIPAGMVEAGREGCVGSMNPKRATYFLGRFKREEKWLGPHEQWALDYTIAILAASSPCDAATVERCKQALRAEQDRLDKEAGDYLMDTSDCINVLSELLATPKAPPQTPPDAGIGSDGAGERV